MNKATLSLRTHDPITNNLNFVNNDAPENQTTRRILPIAFATVLAVAFHGALPTPAPPAPISHGLLLANAPGAAIRDQAIADGMVPMRRAGMLKVKQGLVTPAEILRSVYSIN